MVKRRMKYIIGVDEVGRGCLAGVVTVSALAMPRSLAKLELKIRNFSNKNSKTKIIPLRDSKRLTRKYREEWFKYIESHPQIFYAVASVSPGKIDKVNIRQATNLAAGRAVLKVCKLVSEKLKIQNQSEVFLDGGLRCNSIKFEIYNLKFRTIIRGDETIPAIMLASIAAKVTRDKRMRNLHKKYPEYNFINNVGYGTLAHREALMMYGPTPLHRLTFISKYTTIEKSEARSTKCASQRMTRLRRKILNKF